MDSDCVRTRSKRAVGESDADSVRPRKRSRQKSTEADMLHVVKNEEDDKCAICLSPNKECPAKLDVCAHVFCLVCIRSWISQQGTCPLCKKVGTTLIYNVRDAKGRIRKTTQCVKDLMKAHRDARSAGNGHDSMTTEAAVLNIVIRRIRAEIEVINGQEVDCINSQAMEARKRLCILLTGFRRLGCDIGNKPREDIVNDIMFRKLFYDQLFIVNLVPPVNNEIQLTPELFRTNETLVERTDAFLSRDLQVLCAEPRDVDKVKRVIINNLGILAIENRELVPIIRGVGVISSVRHLLRSLADFLRSGLSLDEYNSRSHHITSAEAANQLAEHYVNSESGEEELVVERVVMNNRISSFPPSISEAIDGMPTWDSSSVYRDQRVNPIPITLNSDADDDGSDEDGGIYTRSCLLNRPAPAMPSRPNMAMSSEEAMSLFGGPSTSAGPSSSMFSRAGGPENHSRLMEMIPLVNTFMNNPDFLRLMQQPGRQTREQGTQTREAGRTGPERQRVTTIADDEPEEVIDISDDDDDVIHDDDDDIHVIESPKEDDSGSGSSDRQRGRR
ncbi:hypothetical protein QR680_014656 [Steinernema hermaphroditum]|uniref:RING-type E3 ubiquitin transferase n=1 Tax=Steinernema hermaphroditum TaxID=289476 RepID=A0AA39M4B0_9BILA|nr:hypothetical protein QR680_014656 [Steinernema hermaphroditum]